jgi:hypothetical protein
MSMVSNVFAPSVDFFLCCPIYKWNMSTWYNQHADLEARTTPSDLHKSSSRELRILFMWGPVQDSHKFL